MVGNSPFLGDMLVLGGVKTTNTVNDTKKMLKKTTANSNMLVFRGVNQDISSN